MSVEEEGAAALVTLKKGSLGWGASGSNFSALDRPPGEDNYDVKQVPGNG